MSEQEYHCEKCNWTPSQRLDDDQKRVVKSRVLFQVDRICTIAQLNLSQKLLLVEELLTVFLASVCPRCQEEALRRLGDSFPTIRAEAAELFADGEAERQIEKEYRESENKNGKNIEED